MDLLIATHNAHKLAELQAMLVDAPFTLRTLASWPEVPEAPETGSTFADNALQKARFVHAATGLPTLADDSGLEVDALGGAPGVHSKRFSPEATDAANNALLQRKLDGVTHRTARFRCVLALVTSTWEGTVDGTCEGRIALAPRGGFGFGYDPLFLPDALDGRTMAEARPEEKNAISHRGRALAHLPDLLRRAGFVFPTPGQGPTG